MIKRPFLWGIGAFIIGILLAWYKIPIPFIISLALVGFLAIYYMIYHVKKYVNRKDGFLWSLPILLVLGFLAMGDRMKPQDIDRMFEEKASCILTGEITMVVKKLWGNSYYLKDNLITLPDQTSYLVEEVLVNTHDYKDYRVGNKVTVSGTIQKFSINTNPGGFNQDLYYKIQNIDYQVKAEDITVTNAAYSKFHYILNIIKEELINVYETVLPEKEAGTLMAMVLGEKYLLGDEINRLYQENGISHILAISGLHVSMVGAAIYFILKKLRLGLVASTILSIAFVYSYGILTNFSVSTNRAVVMYMVMLFANILGKTFDMLSALSLSAFLILIQNPMEIFNVGFVLSFGAVLGIALVLPLLNDLLPTKLSAVKSIYVSICAQIFTIPFVLYYFFQLPIYSLFINLLILPFTSLLLISSLIAGLLGVIYMPLGVFMSGSANYILKLYELICKIGSVLPGNLITIGRPSALQMIIYFILIFAFIYTAKRYGKKRFLGILAIAIVILIIPDTHKGLTVTMLDVGQGEAIFMETEKGSTILLDGGSSNVKQVGKYRIRPYLLYKGIDKLDYAIVTHTDNDHVSGLMEIIEGDEIIIKCLVLPDTKERNDTYLKLEDLARNKGIDLKYVVAGDVFAQENLSITVLHPAKDYIPASNNDYSTVLSISYGEFDMLLTGDVEAKGERELIKWLTDYDVLKVAHHGSKNSTAGEFLQIVKPELSLISCGKNNPYGHPHDEVLERLDDVGSEVFITFGSGAITIKTDGKRIRIEEFIKK